MVDIAIWIIELRSILHVIIHWPVLAACAIVWCVAYKCREESKVKRSRDYKNSERGVGCLSAIVRPANFIAVNAGFAVVALLCSISMYLEYLAWTDANVREAYDRAMLLGMRREPCGSSYSPGRMRVTDGSIIFYGVSVLPWSIWALWTARRRALASSL